VADQWQLLKEVKSEELNQIEALAHVPTDSLWFSGHFPGEPILPGIALIHLVEQAIVRVAGERNEEIQLAALKRVRFTQPVRPGESLSLKITSENAGEETVYSFKIAGKENIVCNGLIVAKRVKKIRRREDSDA
jgi:3-hydroxyacyl-[acyl-carrier-protein] dehydratase